MSAEQEGIIGSTVTHYHIVDKIGHGGMGVVYKAEDTMLDRTVALKFLPPGMAEDKTAEKRFIHEAKAASSLDHSNIAVIHEIARTDKGRLFIVMGYYEGDTLEAKIEGGPLDLDEALDYAIQMAKGLSVAHQAGIVHRDIKPGNAIVTPTGELKILDFGLAKVEDVTMTADGLSLGTVAYMSPEQARDAPLDHRTDLWALGVVFYELLAGRRPFPGTYHAALLYAAANEPHPPVTNHRPEVPAWMVAIIDRLLEKDPEQRFPSAKDLVQALESAGGEVMTGAHATVAVQSAPASGAVPTAGYPGAGGMHSGVQGALTSTGAIPGVTLSGAYLPEPAPAGSRAALWGGGAAVAVLLIAFAGWYFGQASSGPEAAPSGVTEEARAEARSLYAAALDLRTNRQFSRSVTTLEQVLQLDSTYTEAWATLAALEIALQDYPAAVEHANRAVQLGPDNTAAHFNLALGLEGLGQWGEAMLSYEEAVGIDSTFVPAYSAWAYRLIELDRPEDALTVLSAGLAAVPNSPLNFLLFKNRGKALLAMGDPDQAVTALEESVRLNSSSPESLSLLAQAYERVGLPDDALRYWEMYIDAETDPAQVRIVKQRLGL